MNPDDYRFWWSALEAKASGAPVPPLTADKVPCGRWRYADRRGEGRWIAVAVWRGPDGVLQAVEVKDGTYSSVSVDDAMLYAWKHPVTEEAYNLFTETGRWPDDVGPGHNTPPLDGPDGLADVIDSAILAALGEVKDGIADQLQCDRAQNYRDRLLKLAKQVEAEHKKEKAPILEAGRAVDAKWKPLAKRIEEAVALLRQAMTPFLVSQQEAAEAAAPQAEVKVRAGSTGRPATLKTVRVAHITDWREAILAFMDDTDVRDLVQSKCNARARAGLDNGPGWRAIESKRAA